MTTWVEPRAGRSRGPVGILQSWVQVLRHPIEFFGEAISPGDQAPGLVFAMLVVLLEESTRLYMLPEARPMVSGSEVIGSILFVALAALLIAPLSLHAFAAIETLVLLGSPSRGGVSETVQVLAYASAPCVFIGLPIPEIRVVAGLWTALLLVVGFHVVHGLRYPLAVLYPMPAAVIAVGYGFRWFGAVVEVFPAVGAAVPW